MPPDLPGFAAALYEATLASPRAAARHLDPPRTTPGPQPGCHQRAGHRLLRDLLQRHLDQIQLGTARTLSVARPCLRPPSVAVRETADGTHRPSWRHPRPSAMRPWTPQHNGLQRYKVTHAGTEKKRPPTAGNWRYRGAFARGGGG